MTSPFVIVVANDWAFRSCCRAALAAAGYRVATPTTREAAEYFLASAYPPDVVVFRARERWNELLAGAIERAARPLGIAVVDRCPDEKRGGTRPVEEAVHSALEQLAGRPLGWRSELTSGVELVDAPHRALVALLSSLESAVRARLPREAMELLRELEAHTEKHFVSEESLMELRGHRDREDHAREHARLLGELGELAQRCAGDEPPPMSRVVLSLRHWLEGHMMTLDRALARELSPAPADAIDGRGVSWKDSDR